MSTSAAPSSSQASSNIAGTFGLILAAAAILLITMGVRQTTGLFLLPITQSTGVSIVAMSFALAVGQFVFGAAQPVFGAVADKYGAEILREGAHDATLPGARRKALTLLFARIAARRVFRFLDPE